MVVVRRIKTDELYHFGIKGQKWGVRRYQNPDGSLTDAGRKRYGREVEKELRKPYYVGLSKFDYERDRIANHTTAGKDVYSQTEDARNKFKEEKKKFQEVMKDYEDNKDYWMDEAIYETYTKIYGMHKDWPKQQVINEYHDFWKYEDGGQSGEAVSYYLIKKGKEKRA